ncbi:site-specific integrase [Idiomarina sp. M1R2S28]|uniref:Site-specific integrase n=1 Tax=Idiomarina rhizosphaerae TaxID=2961572 RepID=A0A9X2G319_9GAMM|nr:site-specific integrase [Idiomarina rhizosphaerae]MCP1339398.1 site-specific integrase [Idiomarina rhizosphaerae]
MKIFDLIEHISVADETGLLRIKPLNEIDYKKIASTNIYESESVHQNSHKKTKFNDDVWRISGNKSMNFSDLQGALKYEVKAAFLIANYCGVFEGGRGIKFQSAKIQTSHLIKFAKTLQKAGVNSLLMFDSLSGLIKRNYIIKFIEINFIARGTYTFESFQRRFFEEKLNYGLFSNDTVSIFQEEFFRHNLSSEAQDSVLSHPVVPSGVLQRAIQECDKKISGAKNLISDWELANKGFTKAIRQMNGGIGKHNTVSSITKGLTSQTTDPLRIGFKALDNLKLSVLMYLLTFTGMRKEEALSCTIGCAEYKDSKYYIEATLSKTDDTKIKMKWVTNKDTYDAIKLLERYVIGMHDRARAILNNPNLSITSKLKHQLSHGLVKKHIFGVADTLKTVRFTNAALGINSDYDSSVFGNKDSKFSLQLYKYQLTEKDIDQLESLGCNYKAVRGRSKGESYVVGDTFRITPHMLRHTFAWFIIANRLGQLDDIKHQFKHLASSMTMVYAFRGYDSTDEMIDLFEDFEELLVDNIAYEIASQATNGTLKGEGGKRLNDGARNLVFNVTASNGSQTERTIKQIHFSSLEAYKAFLVQNLKNIRGLPHGYCTGGSECKLKNVGIPSGCVYCPNYIVSEKQRIHWQAMKNFADDKLLIYKQLSDEQQTEYSLMAEAWRDTSNAALIILKNSAPDNAEESSA